MTVMMELVLLVFIPMWPLLIALLLALPVIRTWALYLVPFAALPALLSAVFLSSEPELTLPWLLFGSKIGVDDVSRVFLLCFAILWTIGSVLLPKTRRSQFSIWFLITMAGSYTVLLAQDIPLFFLSYTVMSLACFGLVFHERTAEALHAAKVYIVFAVLGEIILLSAFLMVAHNAETLEIEHIVDRTPEDLLIAFLFIGFGIKAGLPLLHMALPPVYSASPLAAVIPMAGGLLHLGLYGWMKFLPLGQTAIPEWSLVFVCIGIIAVIFGVIVGLTQQQARSLLAYSSISQMGLMTIAIGIGLGAPEQWMLIQSVLILFVFHHAISKGALFLGLSISGRGRIGLWLPALALAGLPFTGGALVKGMLKAQTYLLPDFWSTFTYWVVILSSIGTTFLMARFLYLSMSNKSVNEPSVAILWWLLLTGLVMFPWLWPLPEVQFSQSWVTVGLITVAFGVSWLVYKGLFSQFISFIPKLPPGDLLYLVEQLLQKIYQPHAHNHNHHESHSHEVDLLLQLPILKPIALVERFLGRWQVAISLFVFLLLGIFGLLMFS